MMKAIPKTSGYMIGQIVKFNDVVYGMYEGTISRIRRYNGRIIVHIDHANGDSYQVFKEDLDTWNN